MHNHPFISPQPALLTVAPTMAGENSRISRVEAERIIAILDDTIEKLGFLDRSHFDDFGTIGADKSDF